MPNKKDKDMTQQQITPQQALANLNEAAKHYKGTFEDHSLIQHSVQILVNTINELTELKAKQAATEAAPETQTEQQS